MCGIALVVGPTHDYSANLRVFGQMMDAISTRGTVTETLDRPGVLAGTRRLPIVDRAHAVQPWAFGRGGSLLCYNGEIYNYRQVRAELIELGHTFRSDSDTEVVAEAFDEWGADAVVRLRGEYAFAVYEMSSGRTYLARDSLGVKPLYFTRAREQWFIGSEVKALTAPGVPVCEVPAGHHGWPTPDGRSRLRSHFDLTHLGQNASLITDVDDAIAAVRAAIREAISIRIDTDLTVGVVVFRGT